MNRPRALFAAGILALAGAALAVRLPRLAARPMHGDEANQAAKAGELLDAGAYNYDPHQHHGPTLYWLTLPALWLGGAEDFAHSTESMYRIVPVVFGAGLIVLLLLVADGLGRGAAVLAGVLTAISPAMVFYSRYYIQEMLLVFFTFAAIGCAWRYVRTPSIGWAIAAGTSFGLMHATKETWILAAMAMAIGVLLSLAWTWLGRKDEGLGMKDEARQSRSSSSSLILHPSSFLLSACLVAIAFYSSFGTNCQGPLDSILAYKTYFERGTDAGIHKHPWDYYFGLLVAYWPAKGFFWTEGLIVGLAVAGFVATLAKPTLFCGFLSLYTLVLTALYCLIPYKTPWCVLSFLHAMILLAGAGAWAILRRLPGLPLKALACVFLAAGAAHLGWQCCQLNFNPRLYADQRSPWVYAHPSTDVLNLAARIDELARVSPEGHGMAIHVVTPENYWPLPWYLRKLDQDRVGYWQDAATWAEETAQYPPPSVIILTPDVQEALNTRLGAAYNQQMIYGLRPGVLLYVYVRDDLWQAFLVGVAAKASRAS